MSRKSRLWLIIAVIVAIAALTLLGLGWKLTGQPTYFLYHPECGIECTPDCPHFCP